MVFSFGGGLNSRASEDHIAELECADGSVNFALDIDDRAYRPREPFDLVGTAPNGGRINGFAQLLKSDGTTSTLVQAHDTVYEWDGTTNGFTNVGSVNSAMRMRGRLEHNYTLDDKVLITDIALADFVHEWDGTTFQEVNFNSSNVLKAKYCTVIDERAFYGNVNDGSQVIPHMIVASEREAYGTISFGDRPSSALSEGAPFYLLTPDLRGVNGLVEAFGVLAVSSREGSTYKITGSTSKDYAIDPLYPRSFAAGDEAMVYVGNDIVFGRPGRLESLSSTDRFGDVATDDLTRKIQNRLTSDTAWTSVFNSRLQRGYFFPEDEALVWVWHKSFVDDGTGLSPWVPWTTQHSTAYQPTAVMNFLDPNTGLENVFFGDADGNVYRMEGVGTTGDAGTTDIVSRRKTRLVRLPAKVVGSRMSGEISYRRGAAAQAEITMFWGGREPDTSSITVSMAEEDSVTVFGADIYFGDGEAFFGGPVRSRLRSQAIDISGDGADLQLEVAVTGTSDFNIHDIRLVFEGAQQ